MPRAAQLKVFRTPIGFHDAYVAAPSQKAAMAAWGSGTDLFARGEAELVTDPALTAEPLARPGTVIKRLRGTAAEQIAALPPDKPRTAATRGAARPGKSREPSAQAEAQPAAAKPRPAPSRADLDQAEQAAAAAEARQSAERDALAEREAALARERRALDKAQTAETRRLEQARDKAAQAFEAAMRKWRG